MKVENGFTLIEVLIVLVIVGILAGIAVPSFQGLQERARKGTMLSMCKATPSEIQGWLTSTYTNEPVDGDGDGIADDCINEGGSLSDCPPTNPPSNLALSTIIAYANYENNIIHAVSPWFNAPLFVVKNTCDGTPENGKIVLCPITRLSIKFLGYDKTGELLCGVTIVGGE